VEDESKLINRNLYFIEVKLLKILPSLIALVYFINILLNLIGISLNFLSYISGISFISLLFIYISSYVFQFCEYHRLPLHYILITNLLSIIGYEFEITIDMWLYIIIHSILFGLTIFIALYLYLKDKSV
jgi:hypothetical protein